MKGIAHFLAGIAAATFIPGVVESAAQGSYLIVLGGFCGLLPDTLDFRFVRYFETAVSIDPDPAQLDAQAIANQIAAEIERAAETRRSIRVQLHNIPLGPNRWRQYTIHFDSDRSEVVVQIGPIVNSAQAPLSADAQRPARAAVKTKLKYTYEGDLTIDFFNGPSFAFVPRPGGVEVQFLPWHRAWSHSFTLAGALGLAMGLLFGSITAGLVAFAGMSAHIVEDQLGYLGSNLLWPITKERSGGARWLHSGDAIPNILAVWAALVLILFNLDRFSAPLQQRLPLLEPLPFLGLALCLPSAVLIGLYAYEKRRQHMCLEAARQADIVAELQETEV